jgi:PAS domain S-box-containing protein
MAPLRGRLLGRVWLWAGLVAAALAVLSSRLFDSAGFMPHGHCYLWRHDLIAVHATSDLLIGLSYTAISLTLAYLVSRARGGIPFHWMIVAFGTFIIACGATHFMEVWTLWRPNYWLAANIKVVTALASVATAIALPPLVPKALAVVRAEQVAEAQRIELDARISRLSYEQAARAETEAVNQRLRDSETRARTILDTTVDGIITIDERGTIESFNPAAVRIFGWAPEDVVGQNVRMLMPEPYHGEHDDYLANYLRTGDRKVIGIGRVVAGRRKDGSTFPMDLAVSELQLGTRRMFTGIVRDISERKRAEEERERLLAAAEDSRARAEAANRAKDQFLATVSHELRTPLSPILMWSHMLQAGQLDPEKARQAVDAIVRNVNTQAQLIDDLLDVSRIVSGKLRMDVRPVELVPPIEAAVESVRPAADGKQVNLHVILDPRAGLVSGDPQRVQQIVWNLLSNAIKFTPKGGHVHVRLERVNSHVELSVADTGQGIDSALLPHLFERFWQAETGTTRQQGGLGLGLAIVRHLTELHGGTVSAESPGVGHGAVFRVVLPLMATTSATTDPGRRHPAASDETRRPELAQLDGVRVLLVDDEVDCNEALQELLAARGAEVRVAGSAAQALEMLDRWRPEVLVSDIGMPGEDGYALIRHVRARRREDGRDIPGVALTAYASVDDRVKILTAGFQMHVVKPVDPAELIAVVAMLAGRTAGAA